jgi:hypothetical protein
VGASPSLSSLLTVPERGLWLSASRSASGGRDAARYLQMSDKSSGIVYTFKAMLVGIVLFGMCRVTKISSDVC